MRLFGSLHGKLTLTLLILIIWNGAFFLVLSVVTTRGHFQTLDQKLNASMAADVIADNWVVRDRKIDKDALKDVFRKLMAVNPSIEFYLLDQSGTILDYSAPPGKVKRTAVSLEPIDAFLAQSQEFPILGDDPRGLHDQKVFSVAPLREDGVLQGYLYAVIGGEQYESVARMLENSHLLRLSLGISAGGILLTTVAGLVAFTLLTRRLRRINDAMVAFKESSFQQEIEPGTWRTGPRADEIDQLGVTFDAMARRIASQIRQLADADTTRRELVTNISHDLRSPLATLQGYLETLQDRDRKISDQDRHRYLDQTLEHSRRLVRLVDELFELTTLESSDLPLRTEAFALDELVQDVALKFKLAAERRQLRLEMEQPAPLPFTFGDIRLLERMLENLIENAIKFTPPGGEIRIVLTSQGQHNALKVADTGIGIAEDELPKVFERFYRAGQAPQDQQDGSGLGLAIAQRIVTLHGGVITIDSDVNRGSTVTVLLPVAPA